MTATFRRLAAGCATAAIAFAPLPSADAAAPSTLPLTAAGSRASEWWLSALGVEQAWRTTKGKGVTIAVIDSGVDPSVPELRGALVKGTDLSKIGSPDGARPVAGIGTFGEKTSGEHGTEVAVTAAGRGNGPLGTIGVAPEAMIMSISTSERSGRLPEEVRADRAAHRDICDEGIQYAVDHGARVINISLGDGTCSTEGIGYAQRKDVVVVASAGNSGESLRAKGYTGKFGVLDAPAAYPGVVAVAGVNNDLRPAAGSSFGGASFPYGASLQSAGVGLAGPFSYSATQGMVVAAPGGRYARVQGTSFASPVVAGMAALVRSAYPRMPAADVINRLARSASIPGHPALPDPHYGFGVPNAATALSMNPGHLDANPLGDVQGGREHWVAAAWGPEGLRAFVAPTGSVSSRAFAETRGKPKSDVAAPSAADSDGRKIAAVSLLVGAGALLGAFVVVLLLRRSRRVTAPLP